MIVLYYIIAPNSLFVFSIFQALHGFLIAMTSTGKLLYMSENVTDYLGHSMVSQDCMI